MHPEFSLDTSIIHLNHAGIAPWPKRTIDVIKQFADENMTFGSRDFLHWLEVEDELRERLRRLINAESKDDIALLKSTSEALSVIAYGIPWKSGDNVITSRQEFPSNRIIWESLQQRFEVEVRIADLESSASPEQALIQLADGNTRLLAVSSVQYATGLRMDLDKLGNYCRGNDILLCVDAIQSLGVVPFNIKTNHADFVVADGHKWMLGPEGVALFYCNPDRRDQLQLNQFGWHMVEHQGDFDRLQWTPAATARRFESGSPNSLGIHALNASLSLIEETGVAEINDIVSKKILYLINNCLKIGFKCITPKEPLQRAGIVTLMHPEYDNKELYAELQAQGVICAYRGGGIRFSPHFHTTQENLESALEVLRRTVN